MTSLTNEQRRSVYDLMTVGLLGGSLFYNTEFILVQVKKILPHKELILGLTPDNYFKPDSNYHSAHVQLPVFMYIVSIIDFTNYGTYIVTDTFL